MPLRRNSALPLRQTALLRLYEDRLLADGGVTLPEETAKFWIEARSLVVHPDPTRPGMVRVEHPKRDPA
jgi:hypothetical protein